MTLLPHRAPVEVETDPVHPMAYFYPYWREARRQHYEGRTPRATTRSAVLTMVHDESVFLPIWLGYYSRYFGPEDIYVLDHQTTDGSTDAGGFVRIPVSHEGVDHTWMVRTIEGHQRELLDDYDVVLTVDVDEIVTPLPEWGTLEEYLNRIDEDFVNPMGYEVIHLADREPPFRPGLPILDQRGYWFANDAYSKPVLATEPLRWVPGFHMLEDGRQNWDPDLRLIHLHRMDYEICRARHRLRSRRKWNETDLDAGWAAYNRIAGGRKFKRWFYEDSSFEDIEVHVEPIPETWRGLF